MSDNIKVVVKVRPLIPREIEEKLSFQWRVKNNALYQLDANGKELGVQFTFDKVYDEKTKTADVYKDVAKPIVEAAIAGFNGTIFAYGQTSSGKTFTMSGTDHSPGIIQLAVLNLFEQIKNIPDRDFLVRVSYIEIYNESLKDLLNGDNDKIKVRDTLQGVKVDATEKFTSSPEEVMEIMREGEANRQIGATNMNEESSRSHSIFQITIESREHTDGEETVGCVNVSQLNLVDLAGSERAGQTGATGKRFKEGTHINKSLSVLALVIKQLSEYPHKHANYRDSKLTRILQNSLGGNAKTSIICAVTPAAIEETISTLQFANRAKAIKNKPEVNAVKTDKTKLQELTKQLSKLQSELAVKNNLEQDNRNLQNKIENLQKMILFFGQRSIDVGGARRKTWCAPRRMTISTTSLHSVDEEVEATVQRFCTPSLKYNPLSLPMPTPRDFQPIQRASQLPSVSEERIMVTPPPKDKKVNFGEEIIDLDSDEENASNTSRCSPYHSCHNKSETPPCILRKNAKQAEKNLKDLMDLTKRERLYNPDVVEYMEKLEKSTTKIAELEDDIKMLNAKNMEKESEVEQLKDVITKTKTEVETFSSLKAELEARCKDYSTQLTDLEVSYETLKTKAKLREDELLSLLNEQMGYKKPKESISGKSLSRTFDRDFGNFMDMSKDISLVSDTSIDSSNNEPSGQPQQLVDDLRTEITAKNEAIVQLETDLLQQKLAIQSLETTCTELRAEIKKTNSKLEYTDEENRLLKSSVQTLNSTINSQKENLESANNDIESYNSVIKELQAKLTDKKYDSIDFNISDITLDKMIANEEKFIANNENLKNIIHSFKVALKTRNEEIEQLKSNHETDTTSAKTELLLEQLENKEKQIIRLIEETEKSKEQIEENINIINKLMEDNKHVAKTADELSEKLLNAEQRSSDLEKRVLELETERKEFSDQLHECSETRDKLLKNLDDVQNTITVLEKEKEELSELEHEVLRKDKVIAELNSEIESKDNLITSLNSRHIESEQGVCKLKSTISNMQQLLAAHIGEGDAQTEVTTDSSIFDMLSSQLNLLKNGAKDVMSQKELALMNNNHLQKEIEALQCLVDRLTDKENKDENEKENQNKLVTDLTKDIEVLRNELCKMNEQNVELNKEIKLANDRHEMLQQDINEKDKLIISLKKEDKDLRVLLDKALEIDVISRNEIENLQSLIKNNRDTFDQLLQTKEKIIIDLRQDAIDSEKLLDENYIELQKVSKALDDTIGNRDQLLDAIYKAAIILMDKLDNSSEQTPSSNAYSNIIQILNKITNDVISLKCKLDVYENNNTEELEETTKIIDELKEQNQQLINKMSYTENENNVLIVELEQIRIDNKKMTNDLMKSDEVLQQLHTELNEKLCIIDNLETKICEWKNNFTALEESLKQQLLELKISNSELDSQSQTSVQRPSSIRSSETYTIDAELADMNTDQRTMIRRSVTNLLVEPGKYSPESLLTLCCNKIIDAVQPSETELNSGTSNTNTNFETSCAETQTNACDCDRLFTEKTVALEENLNLKAKLEYLESVNCTLLKEQEEVRKELKLLVEPAHELQKRISNHKTHLSTLTATTYAENKLLKSQVKVLQHHNNRIYKVCERDLPTFKKSLQELSSILKTTPLVNRLEANVKRFSLPEVLDRNSSVLKDESTLDGDLLMLDTNVTLASVDNTMLVQDQTCLDGTQVYLETEINTDLIETIDPSVLHTQLQMLSIENEKLTEKINALKDENSKLHEKVTKYSVTVKPNNPRVDAQISPIKFNSSLSENPVDQTVNNTADNICEFCKNNNIQEQTTTEQINRLTNELAEVMTQKSDLEKQYNNLKEDIIANDKLVLKISALEKDNRNQLNTIDKLSKKLSSEHEFLVKLQEENDSLSTQIMENIDESDSLRKDLETMKEEYKALNEKCSKFEESVKNNTVKCTRCAHNTSTPESPIMSKSMLNRSRSDSESSSRCNKLSTLQNELLAGREDCRTISEDVATIKNHLERGELSISHNMDLDESMGEPDVFSLANELNADSPKSNKFKSAMEIPEERAIDIYEIDKAECFHYYIEKTGTKNITQEMKIIDVMKMLYDNFIAKHGNEIENLVNKLKDYEESRNQLVDNINIITSENSKVHEEIKHKDNRIDSIANTLNLIRNNVLIMSEEIASCDVDKNTDQLVAMFKNNILNILDNDFDVSSVNVFENLVDRVINKHQNDLLDIMNRYSILQEHMEQLTTEFSNVTDNLNQIKSQLSEKEKEHTLLKAQKERVDEINRAVTLDIIQREQEIVKIFNAGCQKLIEHDICSTTEINLSEPVGKNITLIIEKFITQWKQSDVAFQEKHKLSLEVANVKAALDEKDEELESLRSQVDKLNELTKNVTRELAVQNEEHQTQKSLHEQLEEIYKKKVEENDANIKIVENLSEQLDSMRATVNEKDNLLQTLQSQNNRQNTDETESNTKIAELMESINNLEHENKNLKSINAMITNESEQNAAQLAQADDTIKKNKTELDKLTAEILTLNQSMKESMGVIESLKLEAKSLVEQNIALKNQFEEANELCSRLKLNIKTHEKSAEIQCKIISRLKQEKENKNSSDGGKEKLVKEKEELSQRLEVLQKKIKELEENKQKCEQEAQELAVAKETLERRVAELEEQVENSLRPRGSLGHGDRRRQTNQDPRTFSEDKLEPDHKKMEAYFATQEKPEDLFMDVDDHSNRSTPARNRKSDSFQSRHEESDSTSRPSSACARRRRRQSIHDMHRHTQNDLQDHLNMLGEMKVNGDNKDSELASLKERLSLCQQELEELRERYREVDEECETCAEYLRERDEQCVQLKNENRNLQQQISDLNEKLQNANVIRNEKNAKRTFANASVNTDEDWANLHSVVVDRMSFDREVEKNKALQRCVDELRFKNGELKATLAKIQKTAERAARNKANLQELEAVKLELETCKRELEEYKERCKELDEECETCGEYLRERDEQLCRLKEAKDALEAKLEALQERDAGSKNLSVRKKRQSMHDMHRNSDVESRDASTETGEELVSLHMEHNNLKFVNESLQNEIGQLKMALERMSQHKQALELQLRAAPAALLPPVYVATGSAIVQNQHLTEVMKENQKLKKMNAKLITICKKRGKPLGESNRENDDPAETG